ncbi:MAG TPA: transglutaminase domain-containing protein [Flavobacterium sp.]
MKISLTKICGAVMFCATLSTASAQSTKPKSYIISKEDSYTIDVRDNKPSVILNAKESKWVGDSESDYVKGDRINYSVAFEDVSNIEAFSLSPDKKKNKVKLVQTADVEIEDIFYHDMKYKYFEFSDLVEGSETFTAYTKQYKVPHLLNSFYFRDRVDVKDSKVILKVSDDVEMGFVLQGMDTEKIKHTTTKEGNYNIHTWQLLDSEREEMFEDAPSLSYFSPHVIFYIKNYKTAEGTTNVVGSIDNLYNFYYQTIKDINKVDQKAVKAKSLELIANSTTEFDKARAIFNYVQSKIKYVAFEDGMGGFVPREAAEVYQKKYGDCKDMANLLNEMLKYAGIESYTAWIGTRHNNYTYEKVPTPIVDNHMIAVAKINSEYVFLDATGEYTLFPGFTSMIQGKQALLKIDEKNYKILPVPVIAADQNKMKVKMQLQLDGTKLSGAADYQLTGFMKSQFNASYKTSLDEKEMLKSYLSRFISSITTSDIKIENADLTENALKINHGLSLDKWIKIADDQIMFKPALFFPYSDSRVSEKRKVPIEFSFKKAYEIEYEYAIPEGYKVEFTPANFKLDTDLIAAEIRYTTSGSKLTVYQKIATNVLLLEKPQFEAWNLAIKNITKQYNQNIILSKI